MSRLLLRGHLGAGDHLLCNGLARTLVARGNDLTIPCYPHNADTVRLMFDDISERIEIICVDNNTQLMALEGPSLDLGHYGLNFNPERFDESFFRQANVPFLNKWTHFHCPIVIPDAPVTRLIHDDPSRGFKIPLEGYRPPKLPIDELHGLIDACEEFHGINSSLAILSDLVDADRKRYLHRYSRNDGGATPVWGRSWIILDAPL